MESMERRGCDGLCIFLKSDCNGCSDRRGELGLLADTYIPSLPLFNIPTVSLAFTDVSSVFYIGIPFWMCTAYDMRRNEMDGTSKRPLSGSPCSQSSIRITSDIVSRRFGIFHVFHSLGP